MAPAWLDPGWFPPHRPASLDRVGRHRRCSGGRCPSEQPHPAPALPMPVRAADASARGATAGVAIEEQHRGDRQEEHHAQVRPRWRPRHPRLLRRGRTRVTRQHVLSALRRHSERGPAQVPITTPPRRRPSPATTMLPLLKRTHEQVNHSRGLAHPHARSQLPRSIAPRPLDLTAGQPVPRYRRPRRPRPLTLLPASPRRPSDGENRLAFVCCGEGAGFLILGPTRLYSYSV
jgi:hypothetical protein